MIISQCPRCHEGFRVPSGPIPKDAYAHCPWCRETFPIAEILGSLPPALEIVSADGKPLAIGEPATAIGSGLQLVESSHRPSGVEALGTWTEGQRSDGFERLEGRHDDDFHSTIAEKTVAETIVDEDWHQDMTLVGSDHGGSAETDDGDPYSTWDGSESSPIRSMNVATKGSSRKRKGSGIGTFVGIVLGGLASVPIAGGLLALMGRTPDWGFWPFQGEQASRSVRAAPLPDSDARLNPTSPPTGTPLRFDRDQAGLEQPADPTLAATEQIINAAQADYSTVDLPDESDQPSRTEIGDQEIASSEAGGSEAVRSMTPAQSVAPAQSDPNAEAGQATASSGSPSTASTPTAEVSSETDELALNASKMIDVMSQYQGEEGERRRRIGLTYQKIAAAAGSFDEPGERLTSLADKIVASTLREDLRLAGWAWLAYPNRQGDGIALIGRANVTDEGAFLTSDSGEKIALISDGEIADGQEVLVMGRLVDQDASLQVAYAQPIP